MTKFTKIAPVEVEPIQWTFLTGSIGTTGITAIGLDDSSYAWGWGTNYHGEIYTQEGAGVRNLPVQMKDHPTNPLRQWGALALGDQFSLGLDASSYAWGWGLNSSGQLGCNQNTGSGIVRPPQSVVGGRQFTKIFTGRDSSLALDASSYAWAWGANASGQLGDGTTAQRSSPVSVVGGRQWTSISVGSDHYVALDASSYAWAWGTNGNGQLGNSTTANASSPVSVLGGKQWLAVACGITYTIALDASSYAWAWGQNGSGQLGDGTVVSKSSPVSVVGGRQFVSVVSGNDTTYAKTGDNRTWAWGLNSNGRLTDNTITNRSSPVSVFTNTLFKSIHPFSQGYLALDYENRVWGGGFNTALLGNSVAWSTPRIISTPKTYETETPAPLFRTLMNTGQAAKGVLLDTSSYAWVWGNSTQPNGLGASYITGVTKPSKVQTDKQWRVIAGGDNYFVGLDASSYAWYWGISTSTGQNGGGFTTAGGSSPISIIGGKQWLDIAAGGGTVVAIDASSFVWAWGTNTTGQLGNGATASMSSPVSVLGGRQARKIAVSPNGWVLMTDSSSFAWAWGSNTNGQLGNGTTSNASSPVSVLGGRRWIALSAGTTTALAIDNSSFAWAWGNGNNGSLGDNTSAGKSSPVSVVGGRRFRSISNIGSAVALDESSFAWTWGTNTIGQLGDGTTTLRLSPVSVVGGHQWESAFLINSGNINLSYMVLAKKGGDTDVLWAWGTELINSVSGPLGALSTSSPVSIIWGTTVTSSNISPRKVFGK